MSSSSPTTYIVELFRRRESSKGYMKYSNLCSMILSSESLTVRDSISGRLLVDLPRDLISAFHLVADSLIRCDHVDGTTRIAIKISSDKLVDMVKELKLKRFCGIKNSMDVSSEHQRKRRKMNRPGQADLLDLPDLSDEIVQFTVMQLLLDPRFEPFVTGLESIVQGCIHMCDEYRVPDTLSDATIAHTPVGTGSSGCSSNECKARKMSTSMMRPETDIPQQRGTQKECPVQLMHGDSNQEKDITTVANAPSSIHMDSLESDEDDNLFFG